MLFTRVISLTYHSSKPSPTGKPFCTIVNITRNPKEHHGSPCDGSVKSAGPLCYHTQMGNNQAHRTKCLWQDVGTISTGMLFITRAQRALTSVQTISAFTHPLLTLPLPRGGGSSRPPKGFSSITFEK